MNLLPKASGTRPRVACDISPQGVVAARSAEAGGPLTAVARVQLAVGAVTASLKPGNIVDRVAVAAAVRRALESIGERPNSRGSDITLVVPDAAVRVLLLEFDALPARLSEALPIVRFRLKKMLPFDADDAMVTFQVMSTSKTIVRVLAVAIPRDVLSEYETAAREAGFEPGAVIPSTLAALAAVDDDTPALLVNANDFGVTAAIVRSGILLLHRSVDLQVQPAGTPANLPPALFEPSPLEASPLEHSPLPLVDVHDTAGEWAAQAPLPEHGRNPYADRVDHVFVDDAAISNTAISNTASEPAPIEHSPYASPTLQADLDAELHNAILVAPTSMQSFADDYAAADLHREPPQQFPLSSNGDGFPLTPHPVELNAEIAQAVSVAVAYFEDTLAAPPAYILSAGPLGADALTGILAGDGLVQADGLRVRELVQAEALLPEAITDAVPPGWLSGVLGALRG